MSENGTLRNVEIGTPTRSEAIFHLADALSRAGLSEGMQLAQVIGPEAAADLTVFNAKLDLLALEALGVTRADIEAAVEEHADKGVI